MNLSKTNEQALEAAIEIALTGTCIEDQKADTVSERIPTYQSGKGFLIGHAHDFSAKYAIDEVRF